jgi:hypothetical protein
MIGFLQDNLSLIDIEVIDMNCNCDANPSGEPISELAGPAGYTAPAQILSNRAHDIKENFAELSKLSAEILGNPLQKMMLADKVYQLMLEDLRHQKERSRNYGRR